MIVDVHAHPVLPSWRAELQARSSGDGPLMKDGMPLPAWSPELAVEVMDANGVDAMVLSAPSGSQIAGREGAAGLARRMNDELAEVVAQRPRRFGAFAVLPLYDMDEALAELRYALDELRFDGVGLLTSAAGVYLGDSRFEPLLAELDRRHATVFVHPDTPAFHETCGLPFSASVLEFMFDSTRAITSLIYSGLRRRYPNFTYIATHAGGVLPFLAERLQLVPRVMPTGYGQNVTPADVAEGLRSFHFDLTAAASDVALTGVLAMTAPSKLLAGFDFPYMPAQTIAPARRQLESSPLLSAQDLPAIYADTALDLLPRLKARLAPIASAAA